MIDTPTLPKEVKIRAESDIQNHGEWATGHSLYMAPFSKMLQDLQPSDTDFVWYVLSLHLIRLFGSQDPSPIHFAVARETLGQDNIEDDQAVDILARTLVQECQNLRANIQKKYFINDDSILLTDEIMVKLSDKEGWYIPERNALPDFIPSNQSCNALDLEFCEFLRTLGERGKEMENALKSNARDSYRNYEESNYNPEYRPQAWSLWISHNPQSLFSPFLKVLSDVVWNDKCKVHWEKGKKNVPALTQGVHPSVAKILSHQVETKEIESKLHMVHSGKIIATLPTIDPKLIPVVTKGVGSLNSLYHHRLIRFECKSSFDNWASGNADARLLKFDRGFSEISEKLGFNNRSAANEIKNILHAQAHMHFHFDDGSSGNLIVLSKFRSSQSGREEGIIITLGPQLLPHYTFQTAKKSRLLIPVPELPPLISSSNSHAAQAALQMLVMQEFADKSIELAEIGSIEISNETWMTLAADAGLSTSVFKQTLDRWVNDGDDGPRFLVKDNNRYSFGKAYNKEEVFLIEQGHLRKKRQNEGKKSAAKRKKK